jgi:peptidoglycan DL-endopeptidase CwlO
MVEAPYSGKPVRVQPVSWDYRELVPLATRPGTTPNRA